MAAGAQEIGQLAAAAEADRDALTRLLRHLVSRGVFEEPSPGHFALNEPARELLTEQARLGLDLNGIGGRMAHSWNTLPAAVRTGRAAYSETFGRSFWDDLDQHPEVATSFDALMGPGHGVPDPQVLIDPADWESIRTVVDVGGGTGTLLAEVLRTQPHVQGTLVDLPRTVARSGEVFQAAGVGDRARAVGQSFFDLLPAGADVYLLKSVLSDWPDAEAESILRRCAEAAGSAGRVVILNGVSPGQPEPDLLMLVLVGGKERSLDEFSMLAGRAGLKVSRSARQASGRFVVECSAG